NSLPERLTVFGPIMGWKSLCIMHLALYRNQSSPTDFPEEGKKQMAAGSKGGLLREIGRFGILALKDFTSILSMHRDKRAELLAAMREIFDGSWTRNVGTEGGRTLTWSGKLGLIAGCTAAIDSYHGVMATMGERFILYRLPTIDPIQQARQALANTGRVRAMREELGVAVTGLFAGLDIHKEPPSIDDSQTDKLVALSALVASARSAVERNPYGGREIDLIPDTEAPARLAQTLCRLYAGMLAIGLDHATAWPLVVKAGLDCIPKLRRAVFDVLLATEDWLTTKTVATRTGYPTMTARRSLEDLNAHGVVDRQPAEKGKGDGKSDLWQVSALARTRYEVIVTEKSPPCECSDHLPSSDPPINKHQRIEEDFSVTTVKTASECGFEGGFDVAETPVATPDRHCWACKEEVGDADRCPSCGWMICACGACSPQCTEEGGV
ncbi:MAG: hypothetical protein LC808_01615, partial [Actinobacteria bacterium]|nr:hypothetical protein [Actinomycetota bacterium]